MPAIHLYFQVHQPYRLNEYTFFDIGYSNEYFNTALNREIIDKVSRKCYLPTNQLLKKLIEEFDGAFRCTFSFSGVLLEQLEQYRPDVLESFQELVATGCVELLSETYYHSLASLYDMEEFDAQVCQHRKTIDRLFGHHPTVFRNTELILHEELFPYCENKAYKGILAEGSKALLGAQSPNQVFQAKGGTLGVLARNFDLSDEIAYRFSDKNHFLYPLTIEKFTHLILKETAGGCINLYMDYETFGEHHWDESHIFDFLAQMPRAIQKKTSYRFENISTAFLSGDRSGYIWPEEASSWADTEKDLSAWCGNVLQRDALSLIYDFKEAVVNRGDGVLLETWRKLQTSDHFYYMSTKAYTDGEVHNYFSPYRSPYDAYLYYTNVLKNLRMVLKIN